VGGLDSPTRIGEADRLVLPVTRGIERCGMGDLVTGSSVVYVGGCEAIEVVGGLGIPTGTDGGDRLVVPVTRGIERSGMG
jgi:hypothetical protein